MVMGRWLWSLGDCGCGHEEMVVVMGRWLWSWGDGGCGHGEMVVVVLGFASDARVCNWLIHS